MPSSLGTRDSSALPTAPGAYFHHNPPSPELRHRWNKQFVQATLSINTRARDDPVPDDSAAPFPNSRVLWSCSTSLEGSQDHGHAVSLVRNRSFRTCHRLILSFLIGIFAQVIRCCLNITALSSYSNLVDSPQSSNSLRCRIPPFR